MFKFVSLFLVTVSSVAVPPLFVAMLALDAVLVARYFDRLATERRIDRARAANREILAVGTFFGGKR